MKNIGMEEIKSLAKPTTEGIHTAVRCNLHKDVHSHLGGRMMDKVSSILLASITPVLGHWMCTGKYNGIGYLHSFADSTKERISAEIKKSF